MIKTTATFDRRSPGADLILSRDAEETLVADGRATLAPSQHVEQKLIGMLRASPVLMSQVQRQLRPCPR